MSDEQLKEWSGLKRDVVACLSIKRPNDHDLGFTRLLLGKTTEELAEIPANLVRPMYEAACAVEFGSPEVLSFRYALQRRLAAEHGLKTKAKG